MKIAISGLNNNENPAPGIGVARSLRKYNLIGLSYDANESGIYEGLFEKVYLMPFPSIGWEDMKNRLIEVKKNGLDILIPNLDAELPMFIKYQKELKEMGIKTYLPSLEQFEKRDKSKLSKLCEEFGVKYPKTKEVFSLEELYKAVKEIGFPCMIKGNYYKAYKALNIDEAIEYFYKISNEWGFPILVQEVVNGIEINYVGFSVNGELKGGVGIKKLTTTNLGKVWNALSIKNEALLNLADTFCKATSWRGGFEVEAISDGKDIYLIEINPRFPAWVNFATKLGINLPKMLVDTILGKEIKRDLNYPYEKMYVRYVDENVVDFEMYKKLLAKKEL